MPCVVYISDKRAFLYIDDAINTVANICERFKPGEVYNIANRDLYNMKEVSDMMLKILGRDNKLVTYKGEDNTATLVKDLDNAKATQELGHKQTVSLEEGLKKTIGWFKETYSSSNKK